MRIWANPTECIDDRSRRPDASWFGLADASTKMSGPQADPWKPYAAWLDSPKFAAFAYKKL